MLFTRAPIGGLSGPCARRGYNNTLSLVILTHREKIGFIVYVGFVQGKVVILWPGWMSERLHLKCKTFTTESHVAIPATILRNDVEMKW